MHFVYKATPEWKDPTIKTSAIPEMKRHTMRVCVQKKNCNTYLIWSYGGGAEQCITIYTCVPREELKYVVGWVVGGGRGKMKYVVRAEGKSFSGPQPSSNTLLNGIALIMVLSTVFCSSSFCHIATFYRSNTQSFTILENLVIVVLLLLVKQITLRNTPLIRHL